MALAWLESKVKRNRPQGFVGSNFFAEAAGSLLHFVRTPSHMKVKGNEEADASESGRQKHPDNKKRRSGIPSLIAHLWEEVGICPMHSPAASRTSSESP